MQEDEIAILVTNLLTAVASIGAVIASILIFHKTIKANRKQELHNNIQKRSIEICDTIVSSKFFELLSEYKKANETQPPNICEIYQRLSQNILSFSFALSAKLLCLIALVPEGKSYKAYLENNMKVFAKSIKTFGEDVQAWCQNKNHKITFNIDTFPANALNICTETVEKLRIYMAEK